MSSDMFTEYECKIFDEWMAAKAAVEAFEEENGIDWAKFEKLRELDDEANDARRCWMQIYDSRIALKYRHFWTDANGDEHEVWDLVAIFESEEDENDWLGGFDQWLRCMEKDGRFTRHDKHNK